MNTNCCICLDDAESLALKCNNENCSSGICYDCSESYLNHCNSELNVLPCCPNTKCKYEYLYGNIPRSLRNIYLEILEKYLMSRDDFKRSPNLIIKKLIDARRNFINTKFPVCMREITYICYSEKINKIDFNIENVNTKKYTIKKCFTLSCKNIHMDELENEYYCQICEKHYCKQCEQLKGRNHVCNENDLESIKLIKTFVKCYNCNARIVKSEGCNFMTCSVCKSKFEYTTGNPADYGGHGNLDIELNSDKSLVDLYKITDINLVNRIKTLEENIKGKEFYFNVDKFNIKKLAKKYEDYIKNKFKGKDSFNELNEIISSLKI